MTSKIERQDWNIHGGTEGPISFGLGAGSRHNIGGWGKEEFIIDASAESKTEDTTEVELLFRPGRLTSPIIIRANGERETVKRPEIVDHRIDPMATITLFPGEELRFSAPNHGISRQYQVKVIQE